MPTKKKQDYNKKDGNDSCGVSDLQDHARAILHARIAGVG